MAIFPIGVPTTRWFLVLAVPPGILIALALGLTNRPWVGITLTLAGVAVCLIEIPPLRWVLVFVVPLGLAIALVLHFTRRD
jgi:hypothetical protein